MLNAQDTVLCSHFARESEVGVATEKVLWKKLSKGWTLLNEVWREAVRWTI